MAYIPNPIQEDADKTLGIINRSLEEKQTIERAKSEGLDYVDLSNLHLNPDLCTIIDEEKAKEGMIMPFFKVGKKLRIAVFDTQIPRTREIIQELKDQKYLLNICLSSRSGIEDSFKIFGLSPKTKQEDFNTDVDEINLDQYEKEITTLFADLEENVSKLSSAELLNILLVGAIKTKASDIHFEPSKSLLNIRFRIDGMLQHIFAVPVDKKDDLITQTKHKAGMKLNVTERPQDGRMFFVINKREVDVRVSALPTPFGEDIVLRILDSQNKEITIDSLGLFDIAEDFLLEALQKPHGMILTTGPTGSGKTTTLYAVLKKMSQPEVKVITIEDPIEYHLDGITQSQISEEGEYTFSNGLKSILRQDPDVVMVGEIRDLETARTAAQASLTGHKVLSTLHTNDAVGAIDRLVNMGLESFMVAPSIDLVIAQRLARKVCPDCSKEIAISNEQKRLFEGVLNRLNKFLKNPVGLSSKIKKAVGCNKCSHTGYLGRAGLYEVVRFSDQVREMILEEKPSGEIRHLVRQESFSIFEAGIIKIMQGETTIEEILRISKADD